MSSYLAAAQIHRSMHRLPRNLKPNSHYIRWGRMRQLILPNEMFYRPPPPLKTDKTRMGKKSRGIGNAVPR